jgi:hypothetical protein
MAVRVFNPGCRSGETVLDRSIRYVVSILGNVNPNQPNPTDHLPEQASNRDYRGRLAMLLLSRLLFTRNAVYDPAQGHGQLCGSVK